MHALENYPAFLREASLAIRDPKGNSWECYLREVNQSQKEKLENSLFGGISDQSHQGRLPELAEREMENSDSGASNFSEAQ